jgi:hypothetical protein
MDCRYELIYTEPLIRIEINGHGPVTFTLEKGSRFILDTD